MELNKYLNYIDYNSYVIISLFLISIIVLILNKITNKFTDKLLFSSYRSSLLNPLTYVRLITHTLGHQNWMHFYSNYLIILITGPMLEEKYGSINLLKMIIITSIVIGIVNSITSKNTSIRGSSGIVFMFIVLSSFVNVVNNKIPITLILIFLFYIVTEIIHSTKKDNVSHLAHLLGALMGLIFGFYY